MRAFRRSAKTATVCWLIMAAAGVLLFVDFPLAGSPDHAAVQSGVHIIIYSYLENITEYIVNS